jgi:hypothetical protein
MPPSPTHRSLLFLLAALGALILLFPALLSIGAPALAETETSLNLPRSGQTTCYDVAGAVSLCPGTGQDGDFRAGLAWPEPRFLDNEDETFTDQLTGLTWTENAETPGNNLYSCSALNITVNWQTALDHVACLNSRNFLGYNDWRLPNINEIESLIHSEYADSTGWLQSQGFINVWGAYWSSTTDLNPDFPNGEMAYAVNLFTGETSIELKNATSYLPAVWPVRGNTSGVAPLWKTGQTTSYANYDDGWYQAGIAWPTPRFEVQGECVTDRLTGLMWSQNADRLNDLVGWQPALEHANDLSLCDYDDWRLPNRKELWSLVNHQVADPAAWLESQGFSNVHYQPQGSTAFFPYWSSTSYVYNPAAAFGVRMDGGYIFSFMKNTSYGGYGYVLPVRSGSVGPVILPTDTPVPTPTLPPSPTPVPKPSISGVLPAQAREGIAVDLQIQGQNFREGTIARLGSSTPLSTTFTSSNLLLAHLPAQAAGYYDISVLNPDGNYAYLSNGFPVFGEQTEDLYGYDYELRPGRFPEVAGEGTTLFFVVHRLGGSAALNNVKVNFYLGDPTQGGTYIGYGSIASLAPNRFSGALTAWAPTQPGSLQICATIDPDNQVAESNENNNLYCNWVEVIASPPTDTTPPSVEAVYTGLSYYTPYINLGVSASDPSPSSGMGWSYFLFWEFVPSINDWLVMEESGWHPYSYYNTLSIFDWPGPRFVEVYAADLAQNVSNPSGWGVFNYIPPDDFLFPGESRWYLYPLLAGDTLQANLTVYWPDPDLYLWSESGARLAVSATDGGAPESLSYTATQDEWVWLEVYAYADYPDFFTSVGVSQAVAQQGSAARQSDALAHPPREQAPIDLANAPLEPSRSFNLPPIAVKVYLPLAIKK